MGECALSVENAPLRAPQSLRKSRTDRSAPAVLLIDCPDSLGIVAAIANFLYRHGANILSSDQHRDNDSGLFFIRVEFDLPNTPQILQSISAEFEQVAAEFRMRWRLESTERRRRVAIFVSRYQHCLVDLLHRNQIGELKCEISAIVSNHEDAMPLAGYYGVPFHCASPAVLRKPELEAEQLEFLAKSSVDLIVLARYMQILSPGFVAQYPFRIINVHHSFLPAFSGARPHHAAFERGVKLIGATSHYVTDELDAGPIIEQDVARISHRDQVENLVEKGRDLEKGVLSRAVRWHLEHRILTFGNKTVVLD